MAKVICLERGPSIYKGGLTTFIGGCLFQNGNTYNARQDYNHKVLLNDETFATSLTVRTNCLLPPTTIEPSFSTDAVLELRTNSDQDHLSMIRMRTPNNGNDHREILAGGNRGLIL